jgi:hypothetical protein
MQIYDKNIKKYFSFCDFSVINMIYSGIWVFISSGWLFGIFLKGEKMMNKKFFVIMAILMLFACAGLWAQSSYEFDILESPQSLATQGLFKSDADNFITTRYYDEVNFDRFFAYTSFDNEEKLTLGFATVVSDMYLAAYYGGNFWSGREGITKTEVKEPNFFGTGSKTFTKLTPFSINKHDPRNRISLLVGMMDMGFRLSYAFSYRSIGGNDVTDGSNYFKSFRTAIGFIAPEIEWGMTRDLIENGIRPKASLQLGFNRDYMKGELYEGPDGKTHGEVFGYSLNYANPKLTLSAGGYRLIDQNNLTVAADLDYELQFRTYNNSYSYRDGSNNKTAKIKGYYYGGQNYEEKGWSMNTFMPSIAASLSAGSFDFGVKFSLPLRFESEKTTSMALDSDYKLKKDGTDEKDSTFIFFPMFNFGMQWNVLPDRFTLNAGALIYLGYAERTKSTGDAYDMGTKVNNSNFSNTSSDFGSTGNYLTLGGTLMLVNNISLQAVCGSGIGELQTNNKISIFDPDDGIFVFGRLLLSLKY